MDPVDLFLSIIFVGLAFILSCISVLAWKRRRGTRLVLVSLAFIMFFIAGIVNLVAEMIGYDGMNLSIENIGLNIVILLLLYLAVVKGD